MRDTCILAIRAYSIRLKSKYNSVSLLATQFLPYNLIKSPHSLKLSQNTGTSFDNSVSPVSNFQMERVKFYRQIWSWFLHAFIFMLLSSSAVENRSLITSDSILLLSILDQVSGIPKFEVFLIYTLMLSLYSQTTNSMTVPRDIEVFPPQQHVGWNQLFPISL